jgi:hypothetical protein
MDSPTGISFSPILSPFSYLEVYHQTLPISTLKSHDLLCCTNLLLANYWPCNNATFIFSSLTPHHQCGDSY